MNPDFALIEADVEVINLTRYELFIPEKRPFFLEGSEMYQQRIRQFYSRRIGDITWGTKAIGTVGKTSFSAIVTSEELAPGRLRRHHPGRLRHRAPPAGAARRVDSGAPRRQPSARRRRPGLGRGRRRAVLHRHAGLHRAAPHRPRPHREGRAGVVRAAGLRQRQHPLPPALHEPRPRHPARTSTPSASSGTTTGGSSTPTSPAASGSRAARSRRSRRERTTTASTATAAPCGPGPWTPSSR